jgi:hypothetical protein
LKKIIVIDKTWDVQSDVLKYTLKVSKGTDTGVVGIFLAGDDRTETVEKAEEVLRDVKARFSEEGIDFSSYVVGSDPAQLVNQIKELMPASLVLIGDIQLPSGKVEVEALRENVSCPVTTVASLESADLRKTQTLGINWGRFALYAIGSVIMYGVFFPKIQVLNEKIFMTGTVIGGIAIMVVVAVHAWIWGNTTQILPKIFKLEK